MTERMELLVLSLLLIMAICFNVVRYGNSKLVLLCAMATAAMHIYARASHDMEGQHGRTVHGTRNGGGDENRRRRAHLKRIVEGFEPTEFLTESFDIHRMPKRFRYVFLRPDAWAPLLSVATLRRLDRATLYKVFATTERFLKVFYNAITSETCHKNALETMSQLMEMMRDLRTDALMNMSVAPGSRRWVNTQFRALETVMAEKAAVLRALIDGKIK